MARGLSIRELEKMADAAVASGRVRVTPAGFVLLDGEIVVSPRIERAFIAAAMRLRLAGGRGVKRATKVRRGRG